MHNMLSNCSVACSDLGEVSSAIVLQRNISNSLKCQVITESCLVLRVGTLSSAKYTESCFPHVIW